MYNPHALHSLRRCLGKLKKEELLSSDFEFRLTHFYQALYSAYNRIYGNRKDSELTLHSLVEVLAVKFKERPGYLKSIDKKREKKPDWYLSHSMAGMMLYVDRFAGDIKGLNEKLDYFDELSVNLLHLMPLLKSPKERNDGGYAVSDYMVVDPKFGTTEDLIRLSRSVHKRDMFLMLDLVVNHTSDEHAWAVKARKGNKKYQNYFYLFADRTVPDLYERSMPEVFPVNAPGNFTWNEEARRWVMTVFNSYQWDLNYTNPDVFREMTAILLSQANWGIDIFRLDAVAFLWKKMGTTCQNLDEAHEILQLFKICTQIVAPGVIFLAEAIVAPNEIMKYFGETEIWSNECDIAYNATLMASLWDAMATHNNRILTQAIHGVPGKPAGTTWINYIRCHDDIGLGYDNQYITNSGYAPKPHRDFMIQYLTGAFDGSFAKGLPFMVNPVTHDARISGSLASLAGLEEALKSGNQERRKFALRRIVLLQGIVIAWEGIPMIYYGDELATLNDYSYAENQSMADDNRWVHRPRIDWKLAELRHKPGTDEEYVFTRVREMLEVRGTYSVFDDNQSLEVMDTGNEYIFSFSRQNQSQKFLFIGNLKDETQLVELHFLKYLRMDWYALTNLLPRDQPELIEGKLQIHPYEMYWLFQEEAEERG